jgi:hypothetical protein
MAVIKIVPMPGAVGDKGDEGAVGPQGPQGAQGLQGVPGADALWSYNGPWQINASYAEGDIVTYQGQLYYTKSVTTAGTLPTNTTKFDLIASKGADGINGTNGTNGADGATPFTLIGAYDNGASYNLGIAVYYNGGTYVRTGNPLNPGYPPTVGAINESWTPIAEKGEQGEPADLESTFTEVSYTVSGGALGTQPTFDGAPLFAGSYTKTGNLVHFRVNVNMSNITNFGTGQYYVSIPFTSEYDVYVRNGQLKHSSGDMYSISGHAVAGSNELKLYTTASNGKEVAFTSSSPVGLNTSCDFHIFGSYFSTPNP